VVSVTIALMTVEDLSRFTGRSVSSFGSFGAFVTEAISQATLLFQLATGRTSLPDNEIEQQLAINGILEMADKIFLGRSYEEVTSSPFQSETIGSYSYSLMTKRIQSGNDTGLTWFDMAVDRLSLWDVAHTIGSGSISVFHDPHMVRYSRHQGIFFGPADLNTIYRGHYSEDPSMVNWFPELNLLPIEPYCHEGIEYDGGSEGTTRDDDTFEYYQYEPANDWIIDHYMDGFPEVTIILLNGSSFRPTVYYIDNNRLRVHMNPAMSGKAELHI
jgi:hypothetical protein